MDIVERSPEYVNGGDEAIERAGSPSMCNVSNMHGDPFTTLKSTSALGMVLRGGGKKGNPLQPKQAMQYWAKDRALRECPDFNPMTIAMLLKAENRTVSALLHAKDGKQVRQVLLAAMRRAA